MDKRNANLATKPHSFFSKLKTCFFLLLVVIIICVAFFLGRNSSNQNSDAQIDSETTKLRFEDIGELATQSAYCTEVNTTSVARKLFGVDLPLTHSKYIYSYNVVVKAGFNFEEIDYHEDSDKKIITVELPEPEIMSCDVDPDFFKVYHEDESLFRRISLEENNTALKTLKAQAKKDAEANGLLDNATSNAKTILTAFIGNTYDLNEYKIEFIEKTT